MERETDSRSVANSATLARPPSSLTAGVASWARPFLARWVDPEWPLLESFLLVPSLLLLVSGDSVRAIFFTSLALHLGFLKWLGWAILTRRSPRQRSFLMFPAEMVVGLALLVLWFYLRNIVGWLVPGSYSLAELRVLMWLVTAVQVAGTGMIIGQSIRHWSADWSPAVRGLLMRSCVYGPFALTVTLTLWSVAQAVFVPSQDGWFHSFIARVYLRDGLFYPHFNGNNPIFYVSGFGAINAVTAAVSGLTVVQAQNLEHILWIVVAFYVVTAAVAFLAERFLALVHFFPPLFLSAYPVHNLPPDLYWTNTPQLTASALLVSIPLVSLLFPVGPRSAFYIAMALQALLSLLVLALSPTCALFLPLACAMALFINCYRGRCTVGDGLLKLVSAQAVFMILAALLVLGSDRFYSTLLLNPARASYMNGSHFGGDSTARRQFFSFSPERGLAAAAAVNPMVFLADWPVDEAQKFPGRRVPWLALALTVAACGVVALQSRSAAGAARQLMITAAVSLACGLAAKYGASFFSGGITNPNQDAQLLQNYTVFLARRIELWLLFVAALSAGVAVYVSPRTRLERVFAGTVTAGALLSLIAWWAPHAGSHLDLRDGYLIPKNVGVAGKITPEDIELAHWIESTLGPDRGPIGLAAVPFKIGDTKLLFPIGSAQALSLYGKQYNFSFQVFDPSRKYSFDDYTEHVVNYFDAEWCLRNGIRYFHMPGTDVYPNHGLARAREIGLLEPIKAVSSSAVYAVRPMPWTPQVVPGPAVPESSYQVSWQSDGTGIGQGSDPHIVFAMDRPMFVHAIRFKYTLTNPASAAAASQLFWKSGGQAFVEQERTARLRLEPAPTEQTLTILVHDTVDRFRFDPDAKPCTFKIRQIELLVKPPER
jgi:hypothetical protein